MSAGQPRSVADGAAPAGTTLRLMREHDLDAVMEIERRAYLFPWTAGIFRDCLRAQYPAWLLVRDQRTIGYGVVSIAAGEAHVLNICVDPVDQGHGHGRGLLRALLALVQGHGARRVFLEVRPSNPVAIALYHAEGFNEIGRRPRYYPAVGGKEDAIVMARELFDDG